MKLYNPETIIKQATPEKTDGATYHITRAGDTIILYSYVPFYALPVHRQAWYYIFTRYNGAAYLNGGSVLYTMRKYRYDYEKKTLPAKYRAIIEDDKNRVTVSDYLKTA